MHLELSLNKLNSLLSMQLKNFFFLKRSEEEYLKSGIEQALSKCERCFANTPNKYYNREGEAYFNPYHSGQYTIFLYYLSNTIYTQYPKLSILADKVYYLNRALNGCDLFYAVELPDVFMLDHPLGSVMGRAEYGNFFTFLQQCTVGNNKGDYPIIGENVIMYSGAKILGKCVIGDNTLLSANSYVKDENIPPDSIVFGTSPNLIIKKRKSY